MSRTVALLATLRIANAPSVVSNVFLGYAIGWWVWAWPERHRFDGPNWQTSFLLALSGVSLYFAGNLANDWFDRKWDESRRPERALPSGLFRPSTYVTAAAVIAAAGVALGFAASVASGITSLVILGLITVYTRYHKQSIWAVVPMGLCRAGLYVMGFLASWPDLGSFENAGPDIMTLVPFKLLLISCLSFGLFSYIAGLSLSARYEGMEDPPQGPRLISRAMIIMPLVAMSCMILPESPATGWIGMLPFAIWLILCLTIFREPVPRYVSALLAGIPLVDFIAAAPVALALDRQTMGQDLSQSPHLLALILVPLAAFVLGRLLQRVAPAT